MQPRTKSTIQQQQAKFLLAGITSSESLINLKQKSPKNAAIVLNIILSDPKEFERIVVNISQLPSLIEAFPNNIDRLLALTVENDRIMLHNNTYHNYEKLINLLPNHTKEVIKSFLPRLKKLNKDDFASFIQQFKAHGNLIINLLISDIEIFNSVIKNVDNFLKLFDLTKIDSPLGKQLLSYVISNPKVFDCLATKSVHVQFFIKSCPEKADALYKLVTSNAKRFSRLVNNASDLHFLAKHSFPNHVIFKEPDIESARKKVEEVEERERQLEMQSPEGRAAYTLGATIGALSSNDATTAIFSNKIYALMGTFLTRKDGGRLAQTCKNAHEIANQEVTRIFIAKNS